MIPAQHNKYADWLFRVYILQLFRKHFYAIHLLGERPQVKANVPMLLLPNHSSWWDGFFIYLLNIRLWHRPTFLMMLEEQLKKNPFFRFLGAYSLDPHSAAGIRQSFKYTLNIFRTSYEKACNICIFPQGELLPWGHRPLGYKPGVMWLLNKVDRPIQIIQLAIRVEMLAQQRPEVFFMFSSIEPRKDSLTLQQLESSHEHLLSCLEEKIIAKEKGMLLLKGRPSVNERFER